MSRDFIYYRVSTSPRETWRSYLIGVNNARMQSGEHPGAKEKKMSRRIIRWWSCEMEIGRYGVLSAYVPYRTGMVPGPYGMYGYQIILI